MIIRQTPMEDPRRMFVHHQDGTRGYKKISCEEIKLTCHHHSEIQSRTVDDWTRKNHKRLELQSI